MHTPWVTLPREAWANLSRNSDVGLDEDTVRRLRTIGDPTDSEDVRQVYIPLVQLINIYRRHHTQTRSDVNDYLNISAEKTPFVIGVAGSVAVGKSTTARLLQELIARSDDHPNVALVPTDGFLHTNAELEKRGLSDRKGFPESYNRRALREFLTAVKSGAEVVRAPVYSHVIYDVLPDEFVDIHRPDVLIFEGLNVLQPAKRRDEVSFGVAVSDFFDYSVYVDADAEVIRQWYIDRFMGFRESAFKDPNSFFRSYAELNDEDAIREANKVWDAVNAPNLRSNIEPTRDRAKVILRKGADHLVESISIRKV